MDNHETASVASADGAGVRSTERFGSDEYANHVGARLLDFFADTTPWHRRLWGAGTVLSLRELEEAVEWSTDHVLSNGAVTWLARDVERLVGRDRAVGEREMRQQLTLALRASLGLGNRHHRRLRQLTDMVNERYLERWSLALDSERTPSPERLAKSVAAHLLDCGYSTGYLHRWAREFVTGTASLGDLLDGAAMLSHGEDRSFEVLVPFRSLPGAGTDLTNSQESWLSPSQAAGWLSSNVGDPTGVRQNGGFLYVVPAKDPQAAVATASDIIERLVVRSSLARALRGGPQPEGSVWVSGESTKFALRSSARGTYVLSLVSESHLYNVTRRTTLDDALELAAALNHGSPGPAIAGGWAAIEALLVSSSDAEDTKGGRGVTAADRMARLVACSWPRAELTGLSYRHKPASPDRLAIAIKSASTNRERSRIVADALTAGQTLVLKTDTDRAAVARMSGLLAAPRATLGDVGTHVRSALRRLYRQRNIVMHGGATTALALDVTLRTAAPLVGAGLDRITHAALSGGLDPLELAERAALQLRLVGGVDGAHVTDLLE